MEQNLLSACQFDQKGGRVLTEKGHTIIMDVSGHHLFESDRFNSGLYSIPLYRPSAKAQVYVHLDTMCASDKIIALSIS